MSTRVKSLNEDAEVSNLVRNVDDILDDVIRDAAPDIVRDIREREVDEDIDEFIDGALHGSWDSKDLDYADPPAIGDPAEVMDAGDNEEVTEMYRLGYEWGWDNPGKIQADQPPPPGIRAEMIEYALENFKSRVTEEFVIDTVEKATGYVKKQMGDVHDLLKKAKQKFGWKIAPAIVGIEVIEHAVLPTALGAIHPIFYGLAAIPTVEILAASALAIAKARMPASAPEEIPPGHLDWYEGEYKAANESLVRQFIREALAPRVKVRGYLKPASSFFTLDEWEEMAAVFLALQEKGIDTRGAGKNITPELLVVIEKYFSYQLLEEVERWDLLTEKNIFDFIEDFVNHRVWGLEREFGSYFPDIRRLKFAYFYSRGDMEPYVLLDDEYTTQLYGSVVNPKELLHFTSENGLARLQKAVQTGNTFDISTFTVAERPFFRSESNLVVTLVGNVRAGFRSDIKSMAVDNGRRACNLYRLEYPGHDMSNVCYELDSCDGDVRTSLWNEYIATPIAILEVRKL